MEKNKVQNDKIQNDKIQPDDEISNEDLDKVAGGLPPPSSFGPPFTPGGQPGVNNWA